MGRAAMTVDGGLVGLPVFAIPSVVAYRQDWVAEAGWWAREMPGRRSLRGRIGRGTNPPPQFGQTLRSTRSTQSAQNVHS